MQTNRQLLIGQLAKAAGVKADTVRFYEKQNLLPKPTRTAAGYRVYDQAALKQLRFIKQAQSLGFSLQEIHRILNLRGEGKTTCRCVLGIAEATLSETEAKLRELQAFRDGLKKHVQQWRYKTQHGGKMAAEFCGLIESSAKPAESAAVQSRPALIEGVKRLPHLKIADVGKRRSQAK
ncbi:MAG: hypothetical protein ABS95_00625 [Verrucomicrobia bacterium SCN 57-15]|nr:MAG: hypothetical protein ABS95_00625 [Verrucomicrobia bacterium SCN 57-15]